jgi:hypothetical protein
MTDTLKNAGGNTQSSVTLPHRERADVNKQSDAQDDSEEAYAFELMPVGDPRPQSK